MARIGAFGQRRRQVALEDDEVPRSAVRALGGRAVLGGRDAEQLDVGQVRQRGLEIRVALADDQDEPRPVGRDDRPGAVVDRQLVRRAPSTAGSGADESDLDRRRRRAGGRR